MSNWQKLFDEAKNLISPGGSNNRVAGILDVSRQALATWQDVESVPIHRALVIEKITRGKITWQQLSPETVREVDDVYQYFLRQEGK